MITAVKAHITAKLTAAGIPAARISDDPDQAAEWPPPQVPYAEMRSDPERLVRDGHRSARSYDDGTRKATVWTRKFWRDLTVRVTVVHKDEAELDSLVTALLAGLDNRFDDGEQTIKVVAGRVLWGGPADRPRDRRRAEIQIRFLGGVYTSATGETLQQLNPPTVTVD